MDKIRPRSEADFSALAAGRAQAVPPTLGVRTRRSAFFGAAARARSAPVPLPQDGEKMQAELREQGTRTKRKAAFSEAASLSARGAQAKRGGASAQKCAGIFSRSEAERNAESKTAQWAVLAATKGSGGLKQARIHKHFVTLLEAESLFAASKVIVLSGAGLAPAKRSANATKNSDRKAVNADRRF